MLELQYLSRQLLRESLARRICLKMCVVPVQLQHWWWFWWWLPAEHSTCMSEYKVVLYIILISNVLPTPPLVGDKNQLTAKNHHSSCEKYWWPHIVFWFPMFYLPSPDWRWEPVLGENHQTSAGWNYQTSTWLRVLWKMLNGGKASGGGR